jgi:hypothetical protein
VVENVLDSGHALDRYTMLTWSTKEDQADYARLLIREDDVTKQRARRQMKTVPYARATGTRLFQTSPMRLRALHRSKSYILATITSTPLAVIQCNVWDHAGELRLWRLTCIFE